MERSEYLVNSIEDKSLDEVVYRLNFNNKESLQKFKNKIENQNNIKKINVILN